MKIVSLLLTLTLLASCASQQEIQSLSQNSVAIASLQARAASDQKETVSTIVDCTEGCGKTKVTVTYFDPRDRQRVTGTRITGTNDVILGVAPSVTNAIGWIAGSVAATRIISDIAETAGGGNTNTHNTTNVIGDGNSDVGKSTLSTHAGNTDNNSTDNSNQNNPVDNANNSQQNQTATPTVVTQPNPTIVTQPQPTIVTPTIVNPVVVQP